MNIHLNLSSITYKNVLNTIVYISLMISLQFSVLKIKNSSMNNFTKIKHFIQRQTTFVTVHLLTKHLKTKLTIYNVMTEGMLMNRWCTATNSLIRLSGRDFPQ